MRFDIYNNKTSINDEVIPKMYKAFRELYLREPKKIAVISPRLDWFPRKITSDKLLQTNAILMTCH